MNNKPKLNVKNPDDFRELSAQIAAEPNLWRFEAKAYPPKVLIENEVFPHPHEVYNCTNCTRADKEDIAYKLKNPDSYRIRCGPLGFLPRLYSTAPRWNDIDCPKFDRKVRIDPINV